MYAESFKLVSTYSLPIHIKNVHFFTPRFKTHDPLMLYGDGKAVYIFNITHFKPRTPPPFPLDKPAPSDANAAADDVDAESLADNVAQLGVDDNDEEPIALGDEA